MKPVILQNMFRCIAGAALCFFAVFVHEGYCQEGNQAALAESETVFSTWDRFEIDKLASIWLLKRFVVGKGVQIYLYSPGTVKMKGTPFDVPYARLRRYQNASTFETILKHYNIHDSRLEYIGQIIHDIEINIWQEKRMAQTHTVQQAVADIIENGKSKDEKIDMSCKYFDELYKASIQMRR